MKAHGESERDEFPVAVFYPDGTHSYITRWVSPREALTVAMVLARDPTRSSIALSSPTAATTPCSAGSTAKASPWPEREELEK